ncbi:MAG: nucleoside-diphosphate-sugar epimerase [Clostridium sp.]|jgi:nucleoside-diphosphate-sugar epimerase
MDRILITGGTGFIGSHVVRYFCENKVIVGCLVRTGSSHKNIEGLPVKFEYGDIKDLESLINLFKNYDCIIHLAGYAFDWGSYEMFYNTNVEGTMNVLKACTKNGIKNVIITASVSVYGEENNNTIKSELSPYNSHYDYFIDKFFPCKLNYYRDTKALAKQKAIEYAKGNGLNLTVLEPAWVYGEREFNTGFFEYLKTVKSGLPILPGSKKNKFHVIYAGDLARAYYLAFEKKLQGINDIIIGNETGELMDKIYGLFCEKAGMKKPFNGSKFIFYPFGFILELIYTIFRVKKPPLMTRGRVNMFYDNIEYSTKKAERLLGFTQEMGLYEGIEKTVNWYKKKNLL